MKFERVILMSAVKTGIKIRNSDDKVMKEVSKRTKMVNFFDKCIQRLKITRPQSVEDCDAAKQLLKNRDTADWAKKKLQGQGVRTFEKDKTGNKWLQNPGLLSGSRYLTALRLRTNTFGTRVVLAQVNKGAPVTCRRCHSQNETLGHILGICIHTKSARIRRHDEIKNFIASIAAKRYTTQIEASFQVNEERKKPDLVIQKDKVIIVADVTVVYEDKNYIKQAARNKESKYGGLAIKLLAEWDGFEKAKVSPIVIGCRGAIPNKTASALKELGLTKADLLTVSMIALRTSIEIANGFIDYDREVL